MTNSMSISDMAPHFSHIKLSFVIIEKSPVSEHEKAVLNEIAANTVLSTNLSSLISKMVVNYDNLEESKITAETLSKFKSELGVFLGSNQNPSLKSEMKLIRILTAVHKKVSFIYEFYSFWITTLEAAKSTEYFTLESL